MQCWNAETRSELKICSDVGGRTVFVKPFLRMVTGLEWEVGDRCSRVRDADVHIFFLLLQVGF
jgi:hypothetical protein